MGGTGRGAGDARDEDLSIGIKVDDYRVNKVGLDTWKGYGLE